MKLQNLALAVFTLFIYSQSFAQKADLKVIEISYPALEELENGDYGSSIVVTIQNTGKTDLENVKVRAWDLDISLKEGKKKWGISKPDYWILEENEGRAEEGELDYDKDWDITHDVLKIKKGEKIKLTFIVEHWIFDSNCEIGVEVDPDNEIEEVDEENNRLGFFAGG